jgi:hypothetical protein
MSLDEMVCLLPSWDKSTIVDKSLEVLGKFGKNYPPFFDTILAAT